MLSGDFVRIGASIRTAKGRPDIISTPTPINKIMSPHYGALRDGNETTIPDDYLPKTYRAPSFRIGPWGIGGQPSPTGGT